jgi:4-hydroxyacetophenone monooxygenase
VRHPVHVIVYPTGFEATKVLWPMTIIGRDGEPVHKRWGERPSAHLGIIVPGYTTSSATTHLAPTWRAAVV